MSLLDQVAAFVKVLGSRLLGPRSEPVYNLSGIGDFGDFGSGQTEDGDDVGEQSVDQVAYGPLGYLARPLPPDAGGYAEAVTLRNDGGLSAIAWRDVRLCEAINPGGSGGTPADGQQCLAGYGGAFFSHSMTAAASGSKRANISTWYVPYSFGSDGVPARAHTISLNPETDSISVVHADGLRVDLVHDAGGGPGIVLTVDGSTFLRLSAGELTLNARKILLKGNVYIGAEAEAGVPMLGGPISPPCPSLFVSPV
jgi:hypothetical protein